MVSVEISHTTFAKLVIIYFSLNNGVLPFLKGSIFFLSRSTDYIKIDYECSIS